MLPSVSSFVLLLAGLVVVTVVRHLQEEHEATMRRAAKACRRGAVAMVASLDRVGSRFARDGISKPL